MNFTLSKFVKIFVSDSGKGWPLNYHFVFDLLAVGAVILVVAALLLPKSIELKRIREQPMKVRVLVEQERDDEQVLQVEQESTDSQDSKRTQQS